MDPMDREILEVRLRHRGKCPYEKNHDKGDGLASFVVGLVAASIVWFMIMALYADSWRSWSTRSGCAVYDSLTGNWKSVPR